MTYKTHLIGGATAGIVMSNMQGGSAADTALIMGTALLGSVLPDIDHQKSKLAQGDAIVGLASAAVCRFTKHRGFTHTVPGALAFAAAIYILMMFNSAQQALIALASAFSGFIVLQLFGKLKRYSVLLALGAYLVMPRLILYIQGKASPIEFSPSTAKLAAIGVFAGCISHMVYDTFSKHGIMWLYPLCRKPLHLLSIKTRSTGEGLFASAMLVVLAFMAVHYYPEVRIVEYFKNMWHAIAVFVTTL